MGDGQLRRKPLNPYCFLIKTKQIVACGIRDRLKTLKKERTPPSKTNITLVSLPTRDSATVLLLIIS